jgi:hypothetical protein
MQLTELGAQVATMGAKEKKQHAAKLIAGTAKVGLYTNGVCYDAAVYVTYLNTTKIKHGDLTRKSGQAWTSALAFKSGKKWDGKERIPAGKAVGFFRKADSKFFHAAISKGGTNILAVNGGKLGAGWQSVDLKKVLGAPDKDGAFEYDRTQIEVWISRL